MMSCGEPSGDVYAAALTSEIKRLEPGAVVTGFGGARLRGAGAALVADFSGLSVTGLIEALRVLPRSWRLYRQLVRAAREDRPDVFVPIDFPDFNLVLARAMKRLGVPIVYYVSPQLWAWRRGRLRPIRRLVDRMLVIFPFEASFYEEAHVPVSFVGHPLVELTPVVARDGFLRRHALDPARPVVALLAGSRRNEVRAILPDLVRTAGVIAARIPDAQFVIARAPHLSDGLFAPLDGWPAAARKPLVLEGHTDEILASANVAIVASGTATVQAALHGCPMVVVYRLAPSTYRLGKRFVHVDTYAMVNLIAGREVVPELIQDAFTPERAGAEALRVLTDESHAAQVRSDLASVRARLGGRGASRRAAEEIIAVARASRA